MKKIKILILGLALSLSIGASSQAVELKDISGHWAEANIRYIAERGFIKGRPDKTFGPNDSITRAEFATMIVGAGTFDRNSYRGRFTDVGQGDWHSVYIQTAYDKGWIKGSPDGKFNPNGRINRVEMAVIMGRIARLENQEPEQGLLMVESGFTDSASIPSWARRDMAYSIHNGIMKGLPNGSFNPSGNSSRAEAATVIRNTLDFFGNI